MPQFDTFSFFSQLLWVLIGFSYLYLALCLYILPAFAAVLKTRARKLTQISGTSDSVNTITVLPASNSLFFENLSNKINSLSFIRNSLSGGINNSYSHLVLKNEAYFKFKFSLLRDVKIVTFFL